MKNIFFIFGMVVLALAFMRIGTATAATPRHTVSHYCSVNAAFTKGYYDGQRQQAMTHDYADQCPKAKQASLDRYYFQGYQAAIKRYHEKAAQK